MIKRIMIVIIVIIRTANLVDTSAEITLKVSDVNNRSNKQFKSEDIEFFDSELDIEKDTIIISNKL